MSLDIHKERKFYRTVFQVVVLSEDHPISEGTDLKDIAYDIDEGDCVGTVTRTSAGELTPKDMADALVDAGSTPDFFQLDENGEDLEEPDTCDMCDDLLSRKDISEGRCGACGTMILPKEGNAGDADTKS